jgi:hypothetical protein
MPDMFVGCWAICRRYLTTQSGRWSLTMYSSKSYTIYSEPAFRMISISTGIFPNVILQVSLNSFKVNGSTHRTKIPACLSRFKTGNECVLGPAATWVVMLLYAQLWRRINYVTPCPSIFLVSISQRM